MLGATGYVLLFFKSKLTEFYQNTELTSEKKTKCANQREDVWIERSVCSFHFADIKKKKHK